MNKDLTIKQEPDFSFEERRAILIDYLLMKIQEHDWHGVSDCANDIRVLEAEEEK